MRCGQRITPPRITEDGRYHIEWFRNTQSKRYLKGHIITVEKIGDTLRHYDPQNGKVITDFYSYIANIKLDRGINLLRVDDKRINPDWAAQILEKAGGKAKVILKVEFRIGLALGSGGVMVRKGRVGMRVRTGQLS